MRNVIVAAAAIAAFGIASAQQAGAADMAVKGPMAAPPILAPLFSWTGPYIGATVGYAFGQSQHCDPPGSGACTSTFDVDGFVAGGTLGYNHQFGNWVLGIETDISYSGADGSTGSSATFGCVGSCRTELNWFGTVRGRVGVAFDRALIYATGGLAFGELYASVGSPVAVSNSSTKTGWTAGAGIEYAFAPNWSAKLEYLYIDLDDLFYDVLAVCGAASCTAVDNTFSVVRLGINYRF